MKKIITVIAVSILLTSCGQSKEEKMLKNYLGKGMLETIKVNIDDTDFKVISIEEIGKIKGKDSLGILKNKLATFWVKNPKQSLIDTLSFKYVKKLLEKSIEQDKQIHKAYQESVLLAIKIDDYAYELDSKSKRDDALDKMLVNQKSLIRVEGLEKKHNSYSKIPEKTLSTKYKANYSITNPMLKVKQTFDKIYYTNDLGTEFLGTID
ncbi:hypothetical protein [Tenacibaculum piscium]|uniref:hypothetical protein n=1 Tax=Tenacibaculum piscium TaxID=1458515 RepID=UPI00187B7F20|nr:hypothetical protein [Tenacibaculum piscium]MBE7691329.1 hypothetical protein [Tenacibaculum piscium]